MAVSLDSLQEKHNLHPWRRFFARWIDLFIFSLLLGTISLVTRPDGTFYGLINHKNPAVVSVTICFLWIFVESTMLFLSGTTPGKILFGITIKNGHGNKPSFPESLKRSFDVWFNGLCFGLPLLCLFTIGYSHKKLVNEGATSWDKRGNFKIQHSKLSASRKYTAAGVVTILTLLFIAMAENQ